MNELVIDGKTYVSSKRAAEITGYAKDYVGQLCREGRVEARLVGRAWYVLETSLREHRFGAEEAVAEPEKEEKPSIIDTWATLRYEAEAVEEPVVPLPEKPTVNILSPKYDGEALEAPEPAPQRLTDSLADLQSAWKDWFSRKDSPETAEEAESQAEEAPEEAVEELRVTIEETVETVEEEAELQESEEVAVPIERIRIRSYKEPQEYAPPAAYAEEEAVIVEERVVRPRKRRAHGGVYALLSLVSAAAIAFGVLGSGVADGVLVKASLPAVNAISGFSSYAK